MLRDVASEGRVHWAMTRPTADQLWNRYRTHLCTVPSLDVSLDISRMSFDAGFLERMKPAMSTALVAMDDLERGSIANPDEKRMVGHYWLRAPQFAPTPEIRAQIHDALAGVKRFVADVHAGRVAPPAGSGGAGKFRCVISIGIGGSALGPMFVADALGRPGRDAMEMIFIDNTDPDGIARELARVEGRLAECLVLVISKSGGTPETRNGMLVVAEAFKQAGLSFAKHAVAVTGAGSNLDKHAIADGGGWLARFPMWDWVGGRTSVTSAVGLLPAALQGLDIDGLLGGAAACDEATRVKDVSKNPAALLALMWHWATNGKGEKDMVVLPYKDRLLLLSRYLQQLIMESIGKRLDLAGNRVDQGLTVYGNKGSTDQHAYVQQLRDGVNNFFALFIRVLEDGGPAMHVEPNVTSGDYLHGFLVGSREALYDNDRQSMLLTVRRVDARTVGALIALFERAVGLYASLVGINAYHQPGVEAGKKAAATILNLQAGVLSSLKSSPQTPDEIARVIGQPNAVESIQLILEHLAANGRARQVSGGSGFTAN